MDKSNKEDLVRGHLLVMFDQLQGHQVSFENTVEVMTGIVREFDDILATQWAESHPLDDDLRRLVDNRVYNTIEIIKTVRERQGCPITWAKKAVDLYRDHAEAREREAARARMMQPPYVAQEWARLMAERPQLLNLDEFTPVSPEVQRAAMQLVVGEPGVMKTLPVQAQHQNARNLDLLPHECFYNGVEPWRDGVDNTVECSGIKATCPRHAPNK